MKQSLLNRRKELADLASKSGIDWAARVRLLPQDDDVLIVMALATLLGLDARAAVNDQGSVPDLVAARRERPPGIDHLERLLLHGN